MLHLWTRNAPSMHQPPKAAFGKGAVPGLEQQAVCQACPPMHRRCQTDVCTTDAPSVDRQHIINAPSKQHAAQAAYGQGAARCARPLMYQKSMHREFTINLPMQQHCTILSKPLMGKRFACELGGQAAHQRCTTNVPSMHHRCTTDAPPMNHRRTINAPSMHHQCTTR